MHNSSSLPDHVLQGNSERIERRRRLHRPHVRYRRRIEENRAVQVEVQRLENIVLLRQESIAQSQLFR